MKLFAAATVALIALTSAASAQDYRIDRRQDMQQHRIEQGIRSGEITRGEAYRLQTEQARIRELERDAKRDGRVDRHEAARIERAQDQASRHIREEKHDSEARGKWGHRNHYSRNNQHSDRSGNWNRRWW